MVLLLEQKSYLEALHFWRFSFAFKNGYRYFILRFITYFDPLKKLIPEVLKNIVIIFSCILNSVPITHTYRISKQNIENLDTHPNSTSTLTASSL